MQQCFCTADHQWSSNHKETQRQREKEEGNTVSETVRLKIISWNANSCSDKSSKVNYWKLIKDIVLAAAAAFKLKLYPTFMAPQ